MNRRFVVEQRLFVLLAWWKHDNRYSDVSDLFVEYFPNVEPSSSATYSNHKLNSRFEQTGTIGELPRSGRYNIHFYRREF